MVQRCPLHIVLSGHGPGRWRWLCGVCSRAHGLCDAYSIGYLDGGCGRSVCGRCVGERPRRVDLGVPETFLTAFQGLRLIGNIKQGDAVLIHAGAR